METALMIVLVILIVGLFLFGIWILKEGICDSDGIIIGLGLFTILLVICPVGYLMYDNYQTSNCEVQVTKVEAIVIDKKYRAPYTTIISTGKTTVPVYHSEEYNITIQYKDVKSTINNKELYNQVQKDEDIDMNLKTYIKKNGEIYKKELKLN